MASITRSPEQKYVDKTENQCTLVKKVERPDLDRVYCGKACTRTAVEYTYQCDREHKTVIFTG